MMIYASPNFHHVCLTHSYCLTFLLWNSYICWCEVGQYVSAPPLVFVATIPDSKWPVYVKYNVMLLARAKSALRH